MFSCFFLLYQSTGFQLVICASPGVPERFKGGVLRKYIAEEILLNIWIASRPNGKNSTVKKKVLLSKRIFQ